MMPDNKEFRKNREINGLREREESTLKPSKKTLTTDIKVAALFTCSSRRGYQSKTQLVSATPPLVMSLP